PFEGVDPAGHVAFVRRLYHKVLDRDADGVGLRDWVGMLHAGSSRADVAAGIWHSAGHARDLVGQFYPPHLNRVPEAAGRAHWATALGGGAAGAEVAVGSLPWEESRAARPDLPSYLTGLYRDVLGRAPDEGGFASWQAAAQAGASHAQIAAGFLG